MICHFIHLQNYSLRLIKHKQTSISHISWQQIFWSRQNQIIRCGYLFELINKCQSNWTFLRKINIQRLKWQSVNYNYCCRLQIFSLSIRAYDRAVVLKPSFEYLSNGFWKFRSIYGTPKGTSYVRIKQAICCSFRILFYFLLFRLVLEIKNKYT